MTPARPGRQVDERYTAEIERLQTAASRALSVARAVVVAGGLILFIWPLAEQFVGERTHLVVNLIIPFFLVMGVGTAARRLRAASARVERAKIDLAEARGRLDELTGLYNVRYLREEVRASVAEAARTGGRFAYVALDLNNFREINNRLGHEVGDELIAAIGDAIGSACPDGAIVARPAGDEFAILLPGVDRASAEQIAESIKRVIERTSLTASSLNTHIPVTASVGIAIHPEDGKDAEALTAAAERAMHRAKLDALDGLARRAEQNSQDVFFSIGDALGRSLEPREVPTNLCEAVAQSLNLGGCSIWLIDERGLLRPRAYFVEDAGVFDRFREMLAEHPISAAEAREHGMLGDGPIFADDAALSPMLPRRFAELMDQGTWLSAVPLSSGRGGVLLMNARHDRTPPPPLGLDVAIARLADAAMSNAGTYHRAQRQAEQLSELSGLNGLLFGEGLFEDRLNQVARQIVNVTGYDAVTIETADPTGARPYFRCYAGRFDGLDVADRERARWLSMKPVLLDPAAREFFASLESPFILDDPATQAPRGFRTLVEEAGIRSVVMLSITWRSELKGLLYFASLRDHGFDDRDVALMQSIAAKLAPALQVAALHVDLERSYAELKDAHLHALLRLAYAAEARDPFTESHLTRIRAIAQAIGTRMGIQGDELEALGYGAVVHDLGKLRVPDTILMNPGSLSDDEWHEMKRHPEWGAEIIGDHPFYDLAREVALTHHERWDGSGYPRGLKGDEIPLAARIVSVADVYDALTSARPYKSAWSPERTIVEMVRMRGKTLCPASVDTFLELWRDGEIERIDAETLDDSVGIDFRGFYAA